MSLWTLSSSGLTQSLADWGCTHAAIAFSSQRPDTLTLVMGQQFTDAALFPYKALVTLQKDGAPWFYGNVATVPRSGAPQSESVTYEIKNPWWYLERLDYQQLWKIYAMGSVISYYKTRAILGLAPDGITRMSNGAVIRDVLSYAISQGAPLAIGAIDPATQFPWDEVVDRKCAEVIRMMLRWSPDVVPQWDYSTAPYPTVHFCQRDNMAAVAADVAEGAPNQKIDIQARLDLVPAGIKINYEQSGPGSDGVTVYDTVSTDTAGDPSSVDAINVTVALSSGTAQYESQAVGYEDIAVNSNDWWYDRFPWLDDASVRDLSFSGQTCSSELPHELQEGILKSWFCIPKTGAPGGLKQWEMATAQCWVTYSKYDEDEVKISQTQELLCYRFIATNVDRSSFSRMIATVDPEQVPVDLAADLWAAISQPHYQGDFVFGQEECDGQVRPGMVFNLLNAMPEWATMRAVVQQVSEDIGAGVTHVRFGPPAHLQVSDLVELFRCNRSRRLSHWFGSRASGKTGDRSTRSEQDGVTPIAIATRGAAKTTLFFHS